MYNQIIDKKKVINFEDIANSDIKYKIDNKDQKNNEVAYNKHLNRVINDQELAFKNSILFKFQNFINFNIEGKLSNRLKNKNIYANKLIKVDLFNLINVSIFLFLLIIMIILLQTTSSKLIINLFTYNHNFNNYLCYLTPGWLIIYMIFNFDIKGYFKMIVNYFSLLIYILFLIFIINTNFEKSYSDSIYMIILLYFMIIYLINIIWYLINKTMVKIFGEIFGLILYFFAILIIFIYAYLFINKTILESNWTILLITFMYFMIFIIKICYEICFYEKIHYEKIINYLKKKKNYSFFKFNFKKDILNEIYLSILPILSFIFLSINFFSLFLYILIKLNDLLSNKSTRNNIQNLFIRREIEVNLIIIFMGIAIIFSFLLKKNFKNTYILFLVNKLILITIFILIFNSGSIFKGNNFLTNFLNSTQISIYFILSIIFLSFIPLFSTKYINFVNSIKFGIIFSFSVFNIYFYFNKTIITLAGVIIVLTLSYLPFIILLVKFVWEGKNNIIVKKKNWFKDKYFLFLWSYLYDLILIFISIVFFNKLDLKNLNYINIIYFVYCLINYILLFFGNILKFKENFNLKDKLLVSKMLNIDLKSKIIFNIINIILLFIFIGMIVLSVWINIPYSYLLVSYYTFYIYFIWILYKNFILTLKIKYKYYVIYYNLAIFLLFTIPFCLMPSLLFYIYINNDKYNSILANAFLFAILICFILWSLLISVIFNTVISKIEDEKMIQYLILNLKVDCFQNFVYSEIDELRALIDCFFSFKSNETFDNFSNFIESGEFIVWWDYSKIKNYKKKLILKENWEIFLKTLDENYDNKKSFLEKLLCIKTKDYKEDFNINNNTKLDKEWFNNVIKQFNSEKEDKFIKEIPEEDDKLEEEKDVFEEIIVQKFNFSLFGKILIDKVNNNILINKQKNLDKFKNIFSKINNENLENKYNNQIENNKNLINELILKKKNLDKKVELDYNKEKDEIIINSKNNNNLDDQLELYKNKDKLFELLKSSEEQRNFFLYLIYKNCSSSNNTPNDKGNSVTYTSFINFFKKIKMHSYFVSTYKVNIFKKELINMKKMFISLSNIKRGETTQDEFNNFKRQQSLKMNYIRQLGVDFKNFILFYKNIANSLPLIVNEYSDEPYTKLILETYSLCKFCLYDFEVIIKEIDFGKYFEELEGKKKKEQEIIQEMEKNKQIENLEKTKLEKQKIIEKEKIKIDDKISDLLKKNEKLEENKLAKQSSNIKNNKSPNLEIEPMKKINASELFKTEKILKKVEKIKTITTNTNNPTNPKIKQNKQIVYDNSKEEKKEKKENNVIISNVNVVKKKSIKKNITTACFCFKINKKDKTEKSNEKIDKTENKGKNQLLYNLGLKNPDEILNNAKISQFQNVPENWKTFSNYLIERINYHKINYEDIIYNSSILLNFTNIIFIISKIANISSGYIKLISSYFPWFKDNETMFYRSKSTWFYNLFEFKFGLSFGYSILYFWIGIYAYKFIQNGTLGIDVKTGRPAAFPHFQFIISIFITAGKGLLGYCVRNLSALFVCNVYNSDLGGYVTIISNSFKCFSDTHIIYLILAFIGLIGFFFFAIIFYPNFQFYEKLLDIKYYAYFIIMDLFLNGFIIIIENFLFDGFFIWSDIIIISVLEILFIIVKILILYFYKPCIILGFNYFEIVLEFIESLPYFCTILLFFIRSSIISFIILLVLVFSTLFIIAAYIYKKLKRNKIYNKNI